MEVSRELLHMNDVFDSGSPADLSRLAAVAFWDITSTITPPLVIHDLESANNMVLPSTISPSSYRQNRSDPVGTLSMSYP